MNYERDNWICQLCNRPINPNLKHPHLRSVSLDHILPLSKGGMHTRSNVQSAHWICNVRKSNNIEMAQLLLY